MSSQNLHGRPVWWLWPLALVLVALLLQHRHGVMGMRPHSDHDNLQESSSLMSSVLFQDVVRDTRGRSARGPLVFRYESDYATHGVTTTPRPRPSDVGHGQVTTMAASKEEEETIPLPVTMSSGQFPMAAITPEDLLGGSLPNGAEMVVIEAAPSGQSIRSLGQATQDGRRPMSSAPNLNIRLENVTFDLEDVQFSAPIIIDKEESKGHKAPQSEALMSGQPGRQGSGYGGSDHSGRFLFQDSPLFGLLSAASSDRREEVAATAADESPGNLYPISMVAATDQVTDLKAKKSPKKSKKAAGGGGRGRNYMREFRASSEYEERTSSEDKPQEMTIDQMKDFIDTDILDMKETLFGGEESDNEAGTEVEEEVMGTGGRRRWDNNSRPQTAHHNRKNRIQKFSSDGRPHLYRRSSNGADDSYSGQETGRDPSAAVAAGGRRAGMPSNQFIYDQFMAELRKTQLDGDLPLPASEAVNSAVVIRPGGGGDRNGQHGGDAAAVAPPLPNIFFDSFIHALQSHATDPAPPLPIVKPPGLPTENVHTLREARAAMAAAATDTKIAAASHIRVRKSPPSPLTPHEYGEVLEGDLDVELLKGDAVEGIRAAPTKEDLNRVRDLMKNLRSEEKDTENEVVRPHHMITATNTTAAPAAVAGKDSKKEPREFERYPKKFARNTPRYPPLDRDKLYSDALLVYLKDFRLPGDDGTTTSSTPPSW